MLRRKLLIRVGLLICAFVAGATVAVWLLQDVLRATEQVNRDASLLIDNVQAVGSAVTTIEAARAEPARPEQAAAGAASRITEAMSRLASHPGLLDRSTPEGLAYGRLGTLIPQFLGRAATSDLTIATHQAVMELAGAVRRHVASEQLAAARYFRVMVIVLTLAALVMVNVAIVVLLRISQMILRPVGALVEGSRELAAEHFDHRVQIDQQDEFGELAHAYNRLAEQLEANEERKTETLRQLAVTLNHDLNNAMSIIELQLGFMDRQAGMDPVVGRHLRETRASLAHMARTVASLKNIRRVVLTEYGPGQKMVDLERSVGEFEEPRNGASNGAGAAHP